MKRAFFAYFPGTATTVALLAGCHSTADDAATRALGQLETLPPGATLPVARFVDSGVQTVCLREPYQMSVAKDEPSSDVVNRHFTATQNIALDEGKWSLVLVRAQRVKSYVYPRTTLDVMSASALLRNPPPGWPNSLAHANCVTRLGGVAVKFTSNGRSYIALGAPIPRP
jgi:hypothetical protein